jgi:hypothetical protein
LAALVLLVVKALMGFLLPNQLCWALGALEAAALTQVLVVREAMAESVAVVEAVVLAPV